MKEVEQANDKIILFIDELHVMVGAGGSEGAIDASNILKPSLARGKLRCLGATTTDEYAKYIEKDPALARRFQSVYIPEPSAEHTIQILQGLRDKYEVHHRVLVPDEAIKTAVHLTGRYLTDKKFPDKAIDLIDESMSKIRNKRERKPTALLEVEKELNALLCETENKADVAESLLLESVVGRRSKNPVVEECIEFCNKVVAPADGSNLPTLVAPEDSAQRKRENETLINGRIAELTAQKTTLTAAWTARNAAINTLFETRTVLSECLDKYRTQRRNNVPDVDDFLKRRIEQKEGEIDALCEKILSSQPESSPNQVSSANNALLPSNTVTGAASKRAALMRRALECADSQVTEAELAGVISQSTGIPVNTMLGDSEKVPITYCMRLYYLYLFSLITSFNAILRTDEAAAHGGGARRGAGGPGRGHRHHRQVHPPVPRGPALPRPTPGCVPHDRPHGKLLYGLSVDDHPADIVMKLQFC